MSEIHHGSPLEPLARSDRARSCLDDLDLGVEVGRVLVGDARDALDERAVDAGAELDARCRSSGPMTASPVEIRAGSASPLESAISASGRWNCELGDPLDAGPGEERPVAEQAERADEVPSGAAAPPRPGAREGSGATYAARAGSGGVLAQLLERAVPP